MSIHLKDINIVATLRHRQSVVSLERAEGENELKAITLLDDEL